MATSDALVPILAAVVSGAFLLLGHRALVYWTARQAAATDRRAKSEDRTAEQIKTEEADKDRTSKSMWGLIDRLTVEVADLHRQMAERNAQLDALHEDMAQFRVIERTLRAENKALRAEVDRLRAQNAVLHARVGAVEERTDTLSADGFPREPGSRGGPDAGKAGPSDGASA